MKLITFIVMIGLILPLAVFSQAQDRLSEILSKKQYAIKIENGQLSGPASDFLAREAVNAQFFLIGEPHGSADVPLFASALFMLLQPKGYTHIALETGPITARRMESLAGKSDGFSTFNFQNPFGLPFYNWKEEAAFLESAYAANGKKGDVFWGLDQEFMASSSFHLQRLYELAPGKTAKSIVKEYLDKATSEFGRVVAAKNPGLMFLASAKSEEFDRLSAAFKRPKNEEAFAILSELRESSEIYQKIFTGRGYESNQQRAKLMKKHFTAYYMAAAQRETRPKVMFKFGANHIKRGRNFTNVFDIGNYVSELADSNDTGSFHLLIMATGGTQNTYVPFGSPESDKAKKVDPVKGNSFGDISPLLKLSEAKGMCIVDLRPLRPLISSGQLVDLPNGFAELAWGYDAVLLIPNVRASTFFPWEGESH